MCAPKSNSYRVLKGLFLAAEGLALLGCLYAITGAICYRFYSKNHIYWSSQHISVRIMRFGEPFLRPMFFSFAAALLILLIVSPICMFSRPLRPAAVKAWVIGALALTCVGYFLSWF